MTISAIDICFSGMRAASTRLDATASNIANVSTSDFRPVEVSSYELRAGVEPGGVGTLTTRGTTVGVDLANEMVDMMTARMQFAASAITVKAASDMRQVIIDTLA